MDQKLDSIKSCVAALVAKELSPHLLPSNSPAWVAVPRVNPQTISYTYTCGRDHTKSFSCKPIFLPTWCPSLSKYTNNFTGTTLVTPPVSPIMQISTCVPAEQVSQTILTTSPCTTPVTVPVNPTVHFYPHVHLQYKCLKVCQ